MNMQFEETINNRPNRIEIPLRIFDELSIIWSDLQRSFPKLQQGSIVIFYM